MFWLFFRRRRNGNDPNAANNGVAAGGAGAAGYYGEPKPGMGISPQQGYAHPAKEGGYEQNPTSPVPPYQGPPSELPTGQQHYIYEAPGPEVQRPAA